MIEEENDQGSMVCTLVESGEIPPQKFWAKNAQNQSRIWFLDPQSIAPKSILNLVIDYA